MVALVRVHLSTIKTHSFKYHRIFSVKDEIVQTYILNQMLYPRESIEAIQEEKNKAKEINQINIDIDISPVTW